jgi:hypothetical protein
MNKTILAIGLLAPLCGCAHFSSCPKQWPSFEMAQSSDHRQLMDAPGPVTGDASRSFWHQADLRAAEWRDRALAMKRDAVDVFETVTHSDVMTCVWTALGIAGYVLAGGHRV